MYRIFKVDAEGRGNKNMKTIFRVVNSRNISLGGEEGPTSFSKEGSPSCGQIIINIFKNKQTYS